MFHRICGPHKVNAGFRLLCRPCKATPVLIEMLKHEVASLCDSDLRDLAAREKMQRKKVRLLLRCSFECKNNAGVDESHAPGWPR